MNCFFPFKKKSQSRYSKSSQEFFIGKEHNLRVFSLSELKTATDNFKDPIGRGGFGTVYKGTIRPPKGEGDPVVVAIKRFIVQQDSRKWLDAVQTLGFVHHPNLVKLLGYCFVDGKGQIQRLLVYEYMANRSLGYHLFDRASATLPWKSRLEIILGAAQGLAYLHEGLEAQVIYRDFKPSNVLLDEYFKPKLSGSSLAKKGPTDEYDHVSTVVAGTIGYIAPEYLATGHLTVQSDVYSFGVVLYEILTGRHAWERNLPPDDHFFLEWVKLHPADSKRFSMIIDPRLENKYSLSAVRKIAKLADACLDKYPRYRPRMSQVVEILKEAIEESVEGSSEKGGSESCALSILAASYKDSMEVQRSVFRLMIESILDSKSKLGLYLHGKREGSKCIVSTNESELLYGTGDIAEEGRSLSDYENLQVSMEELVLLNEVREVVIRGLKLFPEDKEFLTRIIEKLPLSSEKGVFEEILLIAEELEQTPLEVLNYDPMEVPPLFSYHFPILRVLDLSYASVNSLPQSISGLIALKKLILRGCELLMELPAGIGELTNLEVLDLEGTEILSLPKEIVKLINLTCLRVSFYGFSNRTGIPGMALSNLSRLNELIIDATPDEESWDVEVRDIIDALWHLHNLRTIKLYLPTAELLEDLGRNKPMLIFSALAKFRFTVGRLEEHFISRLPRDVEDEFNNLEKLEKGLKFVNGEGIPIQFTKVLEHANAFFLQRHWTAKSLSEFGHENMNKVKFCLVMECNEFRTIIDSEQFYGGGMSKEYSSSDSEDFVDSSEAILLGSLEKLIIRYMKNIESICKGPVVYGCLSNLKSFALHTCPNLTTLFTLDMLDNLMNLEELIVEDCPKINSLVSLKSSDSKSGHFLPRLKKISLLELPELVSISSGLFIAPKLERMVIFYCPKLEKLAAMEVSSTILKVIKGEKEWWDALKWYESDLSTDHEGLLAGLFVPFIRDGELMAQLTED